MALNIATLVDLSFAHLTNAEDAKMAAYSGFTIVVLASGPWAAPGKAIAEKQVRANLAALASQTGHISKNTWESYVSGVFRAADKFANNLAADPAFLAIRDMAEADAIEAMQMEYLKVGVTSGSDIRDWAKLDGFDVFDKEAIKAAAKAKAEAERNAKNLAAAKLWAAGSTTDSATISDMAPASAPVDPLAALTALLGGMAEADLLKALAAVNDRIAFLDAAKARPADKVAPVVADDAKVAPKSQQAKQADRVAMADKLAALGKVRAA